MKGVALGFESEKIYQDVSLILQFLTQEHSVEELLSTALSVGELNLRVMDM